MNSLQFRHYRNVLIAVTTGIAFVWYLLAAVKSFRHAIENEGRRQEQYILEQNDEWIKGEIEKLTSGQSSGVYFYSTTNSDSLVNRLSGMPEIRRLTFETTDLTDDGVKIIATLPNLDKLTIHGGATTDAGLTSLSHIPTLRTLHLVNLKLTDQGLATLLALRDLEYLTIYCGENSKSKLSNAAVQNLRQLKQLKKLNVGGGWLPATAIDELKVLLPNCEIVANYADDEW